MARNKDLDAILKAFAAIPQAARKPIKGALDKGGKELVSRMKYLAPEDDGALQGSIEKTDLNELAIRVEAGGKATMREVREGSGVYFDYALGQEYGVLQGEKGRKQTAQPFFWPSVNTLKNRVRRRVDRAISKAVTDTWGKK